MPPVAAKSKAKVPTRVELCRELLEIERDNPEIFARIKEIKNLLKIDADVAGSFRETFPNLGWVSVSPSKPAVTMGEAPIIVIDAWQGLKQPKRDKLIADGLIRLEPIVKKASYGQVRTELHAT
ncbi:hypothetical protein [Bradyrhizobium roseum]|uniref:hypothetical protein n=1 Tax=Bradyrhizobium roseum TaxID=3056648 RepID=UPI0026361661|nr:hypothetical protein [Bradyrhizobium roseus]WKA31623.1 hypothetical protein QUH67_16315 [Bradyrhizobium roseus]